MKKHLPVLMQCPVFSGISEDNLLTMLSCMKAQVSCFQKNQLVLREGEPAKYMGIVLNGCVQVVPTLPAAAETSSVPLKNPRFSVLHSLVPG